VSRLERRRKYLRRRNFELPYLQICDTRIAQVIYSLIVEKFQANKPKLPTEIDFDHAQAKNSNLLQVATRNCSANIHPLFTHR